MSSPATSKRSADGSTSWQTSATGRCDSRSRTQETRPDERPQRGGCYGMAAVGLPVDGEISLGPVRLPAGRRVIGEDAGEPVAWVTEQAISAPGRVWSALREV